MLVTSASAWALGWFESVEMAWIFDSPGGTVAMILLNTLNLEQPKSIKIISPLRLFDEYFLGDAIQYFLRNKLAKTLFIFSWRDELFY
jgi:hypothetical protein